MPYRTVCTFLFVLFRLAHASVHAAPPFEADARKLDGPIVSPWKAFRPDTAYHGQWLVAGDLDGDGRAELVTARNDNQRVTAALASRLDGAALWRWGEANAGSPMLSYDVPLQVYDLDGDGRAEVYLSVRGFLLVLDGRTGKELRRLPLPGGLEVADCIAFANLRGRPRAQDILVKTRYDRIWAYTADWEPLWEWRPRNGAKTCHHPTLLDLDGDGRDEVMAGYTMLDHDGRELWTLSRDIVEPTKGHLDCAEVFATGRTPAEFRLAISCCGADRLAMIDGTGRLLWKETGRHFESIDAGRLRRDVPGRQIVVDIAHTPFGKASLSLFDDRGNRLGTYACDDSRHHRLIDWDGEGVEEILIAHARRLVDGRGMCVARFGPAAEFASEAGAPAANADPAPFAVVADLDGDERPEIVLHSQTKILIYRNDRAARVPSLKLGTGVNFTLY